MIQELHSSNAVIRSYAWDTTGRQLYVASGSSAFYEITDPHGDVAALAGASALAGTEHFDPWGNLYTSSGTTTPYGFQGSVGSWTDSTSGLVSMGVRWYYPKVSRFLSSDPAAGTADRRTPIDRLRWLYAEDEPIGNSDPTGLGTRCYDDPSCGGLLPHVNPFQPTRSTPQIAPSPPRTTQADRNESRVERALSAMECDEYCKARVALNAEVAYGKNITAISEESSGAILNCVNGVDRKWCTDRSLSSGQRTALTWLAGSGDPGNYGCTTEQCKNDIEWAQAYLTKDQLSLAAWMTLAQTGALPVAAVKNLGIDEPAYVEEEAQPGNDFADLPTRTARGSGAAREYQIKVAGSTETQISGGGTSVWADRVDVATGRAVEAKYVSNPARSPFIRGSGTPDFIREKILIKEEGEFARYGQVINSGESPVVELQVVTNSGEAVPYFETLMGRFNIPGDIRVEEP